MRDIDCRRRAVDKAGSPEGAAGRRGRGSAHARAHLDADADACAASRLMSHTVRETRTLEWAVVIATGERTVQEKHHDSRMVSISQGLPLEMKKATYGRNTIVLRPDLLTMRWIYRKHRSRNEWQWELRDIELTGPRILKNGKAGKQQITNGYWIGQDNLPRLIEELAEKYRPDGDHPFNVPGRTSVTRTADGGGRAARTFATTRCS